MSTGTVKRRLSGPLLKKLSAEFNRREELQKLKVQVLILKDLKAFTDVIQKSTGTDINISENKDKLEEILEAGKEQARALQKRAKSGANAKRFNVVLKKLEKIPAFSSYTVGEDIFLVNSFKSSIDSVKKVILKKFVEGGLITEEEKTKLAPLIHKGHGVEGDAVSQVDIASTIAGLNPAEIVILRDNLNYFFQQSEVPDSVRKIIEDIVINYESVVTKQGKLRQDYFSVINFQEGAENIGTDASDEKAAKEVFRDFVENVLVPELANLAGSSTLLEKVETVLVEPYRDIKSKRVSKKVSKRVKTSTKGKASSKNKRTKSSSPKIVSAGALKQAPPRKRKNANLSVVSILAALNSRLPQTVAANMKSPALNYRTGRFASSVRVTDVINTKKGFPSIGYTYDKNPYQTFEVGFAQGDPNRDPRKLINESIREIMTEYAIGRFFTRRV